MIANFVQFVNLSLECHSLPTTDVVRGKVMFSQLSVILFRAKGRGRMGRVPHVQILGGGVGYILPRSCVVKGVRSFG